MRMPLQSFAPPTTTARYVLVASRKSSQTVPVGEAYLQGGEFVLLGKDILSSKLSHSSFTLCEVSE